MWLSHGLWPAAPVEAHIQTTTLSEIAVNDRSVEWTLRVRTEDLLEPLGLAETDGREQVVVAREQAIAYVLSHLGATAGEQACTRSAGAMQIDPLGTGDGAEGSRTHDVRFDVTFRCEPEATAPITLQYRLFFDLDPLHTGFARVAVDDTLVVSHLFRVQSETMTITGPVGSPWRQALQYLALGIEHIFLGYDHLAFLAALILGTVLARRGTAETAPEAASQRHALIRTIEIVTAFTVGHSITLIHAALNPDSITTDWVEPAIALSVAYVAFENLRPRVAKRRWLVALGFGLVHGFGFASVLHEIGLPTYGYVSALLAFNVGVELGQVAVVSACLPILLALARRDPARFELWGVRAASFAIGVAGVFWFLSRVI